MRSKSNKYTFCTMKPDMEIFLFGKIILIYVARTFQDMQDFCKINTNTVYADALEWRTRILEAKKAYCT